MNSSSSSVHLLATLRFSWYDYIIFTIMLMVSTSIGIYYGCFGSKQKTATEYLLGDKKMKPFPVAASVAVGHFSAIMLIAGTSDVYKYGAFSLWALPSMVLLAIMSIYVYFPVLFNLQLTSAYEYLERRFDNKTRMLASFLYIVTELLVLPLIAYTPALALSAATGFHVNLISLVTCSICVFYTTIGGLKAVVWTDFVQFFIIIGCLVTVCGIGLNSSEGVASIWQKAVDGGRLDIFDFDLDPTKRDSFWIFIIGFTVRWVNYISLSQSGFQKFVSVPTFRDCIWSVVYVAIFMGFIKLFCTVMGLLLYAKYLSCDPVLGKKIEKHEQMVPYYIMEIAGNIPGISGLFIVTIFCASLSTISSSLNALSGVIYRDFVNKFWKNISNKTASKVLKLIVAITGVLCIVLTLPLRHLGDVIPLVVSLSAVPQGPSMGLFTLGVLFPQANTKGAFYGGTIAFTLLASLAVVTKFYQYEKILVYPTKILSTEGCKNLNNTFALLSNSSSVRTIQNFASKTKSSAHLPPFIFRISHYYQCLFGVIITVVVGLVISYITKKDSCVDKCLVSPISHFMLPREAKTEERERETFIEEHEK